MKRTIPLILLTILVFLPWIVASDAETESEELTSILQLRLAGKLDEARSQAIAGLDRPDLTPRDEVALRLELAKIYDRVGLHTNTRPVHAALQEIERAESLAVDTDAATRGAVMRASAAYYYRAEMSDRIFAEASQQAQLAIALLEEAGDTRELSEAVHLLGLIHMQKGDLELARELFDQSLALDESVGVRAWMLGEYHRHVAFVFVLSGDWDSAVPHFEKSLRFRKEAGAIDASLFAAISLGRALIRTGSPEAAAPFLEYAIEIAEGIPSPVGKARAAMVLGEMYENTGNNSRAITAYETALQAAIAVNFAGVESRANEALKRLGE